MATAYFYTKGLLNLVKGAIDFSTDTFHVALMDKSAVPTEFTFNQHTDEKWSDVKAYESDEADYPAVGGVEITVTSANHATVKVELKTTQEKAQFTAEGDISARAAVIFQRIDVEGGVDDDSLLLACIPFGELRESEEAEYAIEWHESGVILEIEATAPA